MKPHGGYWWYLAMNKDLIRITDKVRRVAEYIKRTALMQMGHEYAGNKIPGQTGAASRRTGSTIGRKFTKGNESRYGWPQLSEDYAKRKAKKFPGRPMLVRTGELRDSVVGEGKVSVQGDAVTVSFRVPSYGVDLLQRRNWLRPSQDELLTLTQNTQRRIDAMIKQFNQKGSAIDSQ